MFILSSNKRLEPQLSEFDRLYAYPNSPNITNNHMIILDSGAFALSCKKQSMDDEYIKNLAAHYETYRDYENLYFIAPDVFKFPVLSMKQYEYFKSFCDVDVAPVLQFSSPTADLFTAKKQINFYKQFGKPRLICISNHQFNIDNQSSNIRHIVNMVHQAFGDIKIHVLGAGFNSLDVAKWMATGVTSMDSVSYYSDAPHHKWQFGKATVEASNDNFKETALCNAKIAIESAKNYKVIA